jgi:hypothetical protein
MFDKLELSMRRLLIGLFLWVYPTSPCLAWGEEGHHVVAEIAARLLSKEAKAGTEELLGKSTRLAEVSSWADEIIDERRYTNDWHMVEIPHDAAGYERMRDCLNDNCVVEKIKEFARLLHDRELTRTEREEALKFLVHFVADAHVPIHAHARLNGWEGPWIRIRGTTLQLHTWWDSGFFHEYGAGPDKIAASLSFEITAEQRNAWSSGTPDDWANESFQIARDFIAKHDLLSADRRRNNSKGSPIDLPNSVIADTAPIIGQRLQMAGIRLAWLLNQAWK